jgi:hypothetical protein
MNKKIVAFLAAVTLMPCFAFAMREDTSLIDTPTAEIAPVRTFAVNTRLFPGGGVLSYFDFTVLDRLSIGTAFTLEHLIGTNDEKMKILVPALQLKFRFYDGDEYLPAFATGFDNQGFHYNHHTNKYEQAGKGFYVVGTKEVLFPGFVVNPGLNVTANNFEFYKLSGFVGAEYNIKDMVAFLAEWDDMRTIRGSRLNGGLRIYLSDAFGIDVMMRDFNHKAERIAQLKYTCSL